MNRIEQVREVVDDILLHMSDAMERRCAYLHLYGVAQACALIAQKRGENVELAVIAGMQHCLYNPLQPTKMQKKVRYEKLMIEFGIQ